MLSGRGVLVRAVKGEWRDVTAGSLLGAGHQAGEALVPVLIGVVIDQAVARGDSAGLVRWIAVLAVVYVGLSFSFRFGARAGERAAERAGHTLRVEITRRVLAPGGGAESGRLPGALVNIATGDAKRVGAVNMALIQAIAALAGLLVGAVFLLRVSVPLGLLVVLGVPPLLWLGHLLGKPLEHRSAAEQERAAHASGVAADLVSGLRVLKGLGAERPALARYRATSRESLAATLRAARAEAWQSGAVLALTGLFISVVALVGGRLAVRGDISLGELVSAVGLALFLLGPFEVLAWVNAEFAQGRASAARIAGVLASPPAVSAGTGACELPQPVRGRVRLRGVSYGPLREVDLEAAPGELLGVVTADPAEATALLQLLSRDADPADGVIEVDGVPVSGPDPDEVREAVLVAAHDADLFEGSLTGNVEAAAASKPLVGRALVASGADEVARTLPRGGDTVIAERGQSLSGGQRQRVALARALAANPPVLVLHEPTTAVDAVTEARIAAGIQEIREGRTTIVVTTSPALLAVTGRVVLLDAGRVAEEATHTDLVLRHEGYRTAVLA